MILSVSRRTDIPAHYSDWFLNRLREGFVYVRNPRVPRLIWKIPLSPEDVEGIVFWTKDGRKLSSLLEETEKLGYQNYYINYTCTPYGKDLEPGLPPKGELLLNIRELGDTLGKERIFLRYDPVLVTDSFTVEDHCRGFAELCEKAAGSVDRIVFSFLDLYPGMNGRFSPVSERDRGILSREFKKISDRFGIPLQSCCEDVREYGILPGACIDGKHLEGLSGKPLIQIRDRNQRRECRCMPAVDIGGYNTCVTGCKYCYAVSSDRRIPYDPKSPVLRDIIRPEDEIRERRPPSLLGKVKQLNFL